MEKRGQLSIFIIVGILVVGLVVAFFIFRNSSSDSDFPEGFEPVYQSFVSCIEERVSVGVNVLQSQGGYIYLPNFEPGSRYSPFSSQLDFLGNPIPYWYYVSGNNLPKTQIPSLKSMENEIKRYIEEEAKNCIFDQYYNEGFEVYLGEPEAEVKILDDQVLVDLDMDFSLSLNDESASASRHRIFYNTNLGKLYESAIKIYNHEQETLFLEERAVDTLRLYAPVDGVELTCSPVYWNPEEVFENLKKGIEANTLALKTKGSDFTLSDERNKYFVLDLELDNDVRFLTSPNWSYTYEVTPVDGSLMVSQPVGNQPGLGIIGFCYVPYHFVYNVKYPVLIQVYEGEEIFQFPVAVVLEGNNPRQPVEGSEASEFDLVPLCEYKNNPLKVSVYDNDFNPVNADIGFECFGTRCEIGKTETGMLQDDFPQCVNGFITARADGFKDERYMFSTTQSGEVEIFMSRLYDVNLDLLLDSRSYGGEAMITFVSDDSSQTVVYPSQKSVSLHEGQYEVSVFIYRNSTLRINEQEIEQCYEVPVSGIGALFGLTNEKCVKTTIPSQVLSNVLAGGGNQNYYILSSELQSGKLTLNVDSLKLPSTLEDLQKNYELFEAKGVDLRFG